MKLRPQEREVVTLLREAGVTGVTPQQILQRLDQLPPYRGKQRADNKVYHKMPAVLVNRIRNALGKKAVRTIIEDGVTRYYAGELP